ncbi:MAG: hypothetical protein EBV03_08030 [Proteobacteria bacterium]|nr:hypothetical protein [Pseudomonadota bacterium]
MSTALVLYNADYLIPHDTLRSMAQAARPITAPGPFLSVDSIENAREIVNNWTTACSPEGLLKTFEEAEHYLAREDTRACRSMIDAFDHKARRSLASAHKALDRVRRELAAKRPSAQMVGQALHYAHGELEEVHDRIRYHLKEACERVHREMPPISACSIKTDSPPVQALEDLQELKIMIKEGVSLIPAFLKKNMQVAP